MKLKNTRLSERSHVPIEGHMSYDSTYQHMKCPNRRIHRDRKQTGGGQGLRRRGWGVTANGDVSFWGVGDVLQLARGDGCTTL